MKQEAIATSRQIIAFHSKSFALASRLLPADVRDAAVVVYAWCRRADDAVDMVSPEQGRARLAALRSELDAIYAGDPLDEEIPAAFAEVVRAREIPKRYPHELLEGLAMDVEETYYDSMPRLLLYCYRVAGVVGLMMCHVMGVRRDAATLHAAHLGAAMQLTNICRDVAEDWERGRLYLPADVLGQHGCEDLAQHLGGGFPEAARPGVAAATADLLDAADVYYRSGDRGMSALSVRCGFSVRTARRVYSAIGARVRAHGCDPLAGRAWVTQGAKLRMAARSAAASVASVPSELWAFGMRGLRPHIPSVEVGPDDAFPPLAPAAVSERSPGARTMRARITR